MKPVYVSQVRQFSGSDSGGNGWGSGADNTNSGSGLFGWLFGGDSKGEETPRTINYNEGQPPP